MLNKCESLFFSQALWEALKWIETDRISRETEHMLDRHKCFENTEKSQYILATAEGFMEVNLEL